MTTSRRMTCVQTKQNVYESRRLRWLRLKHPRAWLKYVVLERIVR